MIAFKVDGVDFQVRVPQLDRLYDNTSISFIADEGAVNGKYHYDEHGVAYIDLCWSGPNPEVCSNPMYALVEKSPNVQGPMRQLYSKSLIIVYGTPQDQELRTSMKTFAVYLANQIVIAHDTYVRVLSGMFLNFRNSLFIPYNLFFVFILIDVEYNTELNERSSVLSSTDNIMFIGGPKTNKFMKKLVQNDASISKIIKSFMPVNFTSIFDDSSNFYTESDGYFEEFDIEGISFGGIEDVAMFVFPIEYPLKGTNFVGRHSRWISESRGRLAAAFIANSPDGYLRLSRLAMPTIPPMVRAPFANYIPDFMVIDNSIWDRGFGAVKLAGFWDASWKFSIDSSYVRSDYIF